MSIQLRHFPKAPVPIPNMDTHFVIYSANEQALTNGEAGYWSNECGWTAKEAATIFTQEETTVVCLPVSAGNDAKWETLREAFKE